MTSFSDNRKYIENEFENAKFDTSTGLSAKELFDILSEKVRLLDGGIIERGDEINNLMDALAEVTSEWCISEQALHSMDLDDFEELMAGDVKYEDVCR